MADPSPDRAFDGREAISEIQAARTMLELLNERLPAMEEALNASVKERTRSLKRIALGSAAIAVLALMSAFGSWVALDRAETARDRSETTLSEALVAACERGNDTRRAAITTLETFVTSLLGENHEQAEEVLRQLDVAVQSGLAPVDCSQVVNPQRGVR